MIGHVHILVANELAVVPTSQTIDGNVGGTTPPYTINGGIPPYTITTDNSSLPPTPATVAASGGTFTVTVPAATAATTVTYTVSDSEGHTVTATLDVTVPPTPPTPPTPDFTLSCDPTTLTISALSSGLTTCTITSVNSFSAPVTLACLGLPGASTCTFNPVSPVTPPAGLSTDVTVTVNVGAVASNTYPFVFQGSGGATHPVPLTLIVP